MTAISNLLIPDWGNRTQLLPKKLSYVLSLDLDFLFPDGNLYPGSFLDVLPPREGPSLYHHGDATNVRAIDGSILDLPTGRARLGFVELVFRSLETAELNGRISFDLEEGLPLQLTLGGVANFDASFAASFDESSPTRKEWPPQHEGKVFCATRQECDVRALRWMLRRQLFGFGRMNLLSARDPVQRRPVLRLTFDLYTAE